MRISANAQHLSFSGEFRSKEMEAAYLKFSWLDIKSVTRYALLITAFLCMVFFIVDIMSVGNQKAIYYLLAVRLLAVSVYLSAAEYIHRKKQYFAGYPYLMLFIKIVIALNIWALAVLRQMPTAYLAVNTILFTLFFYQFMKGRLDFTIGACAFMNLGSIVVGYLYLNMIPTELIGSFLLLIPLNTLGIVIARSINRSKRSEYIALMDFERINAEKEKLIKKLRSALAEVRTLQGFLPICARCHKIRDDKGYWERIEVYIQDRTQAKFSHGVCPDCAEMLYGPLLKKLPLKVPGREPT
jgi:hypothetical protein